MVVNYSLTIKNSSRARNVIAGADSQVVVQHEGDELVFQRESLFQCFAKVGISIDPVTGCGWVG